MNRLSPLYQPTNPFQALSYVYRYGFQGQEEDGELWSGSVSYKYRVEDARLGRFFSVDPLKSEYPEIGTYVVSGNRTIDCIDWEGLEPAQIIFDEGHERVREVRLANDSYQHLNSQKLIHPNSDLALNQKDREIYSRLRQEAADDYYSKPFLKVVPDNLLHRGKPLKLFSNYALQGSVVEGEMLRKEGWNNGGKQVFFGTIGVILSGGTLAYSELGAVAAVWEGTSLTLSVDDISKGFFSDGKSSLLTEAGISSEALDKLKLANDARSFTSGLRSLIKSVVDDPGKSISMSDRTWEIINNVNDQLMLLEGAMDEAKKGSE